MSDYTPPTQNPVPSGQPGPPAPQYGQQSGPPPYTQAPAAGLPAAYPAAPAYVQQYGGYAPAAKTNVLAIVSLVSSLVGIIIVPFVGSIVGVITGHMSLGQLKTSGEQGRGLALAGTIVGWVGLALSILGIIAMIAWFSWFIPYMAQVSTS